MTQQQFQAMVVREEPGNIYIRDICKKSLTELPEHDVLVRVLFSSLNYKDALSATGNRGVTRLYPHTPGIDAAGTVVESRSDKFKSGDKVIVSGYGLGTKIPGGFGEFIRVPVEWIVPLPAGLTLRESMIYGTAGFTAAQSVLKIVTHGVKPDDGKILVSGSTGGVGSVSVAILAKAGYRVTAITGKMTEHALLARLGAKEIISRQEATDTTGRMMLKEKWAGVIDTVGGEILTTSIRSTGYGGIVTCCGNVASPKLNLSVYPFILRGVTLTGIDSANCPLAVRRQIWEKLATDWKIDQLDDLAREVGLDYLSPEIDNILHGKTRGRIVLRL